MPDSISIKELTLFRSIVAVHDDPGRYKTVGTDGISEHCLLPGTLMYASIADDPEQFKAYCEKRMGSWRRPTTITGEKPRKFTGTTWLVLVLVLIGLAECIKSFASWVAYLWGLL